MSQATITLPTGPGVLAVAVVLRNVTGVNYRFDSQVLEVSHDSVVSYFDYAEAATVTMTISGDNTTVTVTS